MPTQPTTTLRRQLATKKRYVDFTNSRADHECALLAAMGFSTRYIGSRTELTACQISYRIRKAGLTQDNGASRLDFRNGTSPFAATLLGLARQHVDKDLVRFLKKNT